MFGKIRIKFISPDSANTFEFFTICFSYLLFQKFKSNFKLVFPIPMGNRYFFC